MATTLYSGPYATAPCQPPSLRAGFGAAIQDRMDPTLVLRPLDCRVASAPRNDGGTAEHAAQSNAWLA